MNEVDNDILRLILHRFSTKGDAFFIRLVCKRWASFVTPPNMDVNSLAEKYAQINCRSAFDWFETTGYSRYLKTIRNVNYIEMTGYVRMSSIEL